MSMIRLMFVVLLMGVVLSFASPSQAVITGPYSVDANTLHLWQFDVDPPAAIPDAAGSIPLNFINSATTNSSFSQAAPNSPVNYSSALNVSGNSSRAATSTATNHNVSSFEGANGAFTMEAIVRLGFNPDSNGSDDFGILSMVGSAVSLFEFNYHKQAGVTADRIEFVVNNTMVGQANLPTSGQDVPVQNGWYHVAVTYNGNPNGLGMYWTRVDGYADAAAEPVAASPLTLSNNSLTGDLTTQPVTLGQVIAGNAGTGFEFAGLVDQIRVSGIVRPANDFIFQVPEPSSILMLGVGIVGLEAIRRKRRK